jgi:hypothetical protein
MKRVGQFWRSLLPEEKQMTTDLNRSVGASSAKHRGWKSHWDRLRQEARRLQVRIAKALRNRSWIAGSPRQRLMFNAHLKGQRVEVEEFIPYSPRLSPHLRQAMEKSIHNQLIAAVIRPERAGVVRRHGFCYNLREKAENYGIKPPSYDRRFHFGGPDVMTIVCP